MRLSKAAYNWALKHLTHEGDTDLFPPLFEIEALKMNWSIVLDDLVGLDVEQHNWQGGRSFVVPKDRFVFRTATQLDPLDSLILAALMKQTGKKIEAARLPESQMRVFSYRFAPTSSGRFYGQTNGWNQFWAHSLAKARLSENKWVVVTDITDFYNQIDHHLLENQIQTIVDKEAMRAIKGMLQSVTNKVSRGIPVGPHSVHLLAECALNTIDRSLVSRGYDYCRYVDDIHIFCKSREKAEIALFDFADILNKQQRLSVQKQKTAVMPVEDFIQFAQRMTEERPINEQEETLLKIIRAKTSGDPYRKISLDALTPEELSRFDGDEIKRIFQIYLKAQDVDYARVGWLLRRLSQIGVPGGLEFVLDNLDQLMPVVGNAARYIMSAARNYKGDMVALGQRLLSALDSNLVKHSEYLQMILLDVFSRVPKLNHIASLTERYHYATPAVRRELVMAAAAAAQGHWLRELKDNFKTADPWLRPALVAAARCFPGDEGAIWIQHIRKNANTMEYLVSKSVLGEKLKKGEIKFR